MSNDYFDTYNVLSDEEKKELILLQKIKTNIKRFIPNEKRVNKIKEIILKSDKFDFASKFSENFISYTKPLFIMKLNKKNIDREFLFDKEKNDDFFVNGRTNSKYEKDIKYIQDLVYNEIIKEFSSFMTNFIMDEEKFNSVLEDNDINISLDKKYLSAITLSSEVVFSIKVDLKNDKVMLEYAI